MKSRIHPCGKTKKHCIWKLILELGKTVMKECQGIEVKDITNEFGLKGTDSKELCENLLAIYM